LLERQLRLDELEPPDGDKTVSNAGNNAIVR
jgi:hypothetical protein